MKNWFSIVITNVVEIALLDYEDFVLKWALLNESEP